MATKTLFFKNVAVNSFGSLSETDPGASTMVTGWVVAKIAASNFSKVLYGTERASGTFGADALTTATAPASASADAFRSENTINGTFANANWTITLAVRAVTSASGQLGRVKCRLWRGTDATGSGATQITSSVLTGGITGAIGTGADATSVITYSPGATITLTNEYLFIQFEWEITTVSTNNSGDVDIRASASRILTSDFTLGPVLGNLSITEANDTISADADVIVKGNLSVTEANDTLSADADVVIGGALNVTEAADTLSATGTVFTPTVTSKPAAALLIGP